MNGIYNALEIAFVIVMIIAGAFILHACLPTPELTYMQAYWNLLDRIDLAKTDEELWQLDLDITDYYEEKDAYTKFLSLQKAARERLLEIRNEEPQVYTAEPQKELKSV